MDALNQTDLTRLRATIAAARLEKSRRAEDIASSETSPERRQFAIRRHSALVHELRMNAEELKGIIAAAKRAEAKRTQNFHPRYTQNR
jgi:hypothetical protein